jgi:oxygen-independent coproporphyrinogen III oxidase
MGGIMASRSPAIADYYSREKALESLESSDPNYPESNATVVLADPANDHLLGYVFAEAFTHVFPGDRTGYLPAHFFSDLDAELASSPTFHLWTEIPLCRYRCHFCQFPILVLSHKEEQSVATAKRWVDANIAEAKLWLEAVPSLRETPVGEFCLFGGTPTAIPIGELARLIDFYVEHFNFTGDTSLRAEGSPDSITKENLSALHRMGFKTLTYGIQSFDDDLLKLANRRHTGGEAAQAIVTAHDLSFERVDGDLLWGLPGQGVADFVADVRRMIELSFSTINIIKLHLRLFSEVDTAIGHESPAAWQLPKVRERIAKGGHRWPSLSEQYQMREAAVDLLEQAGYYEHPTTYFPKRKLGPERWRALNLDQDKQYPQVGIGLGGYTWSSRSEANVVSGPREYLKRVDAGEIPLETVAGISNKGREVRSIRMALSTCQPLTEEVHRRRFPGSSLFEGHWADVFSSMARRGLAIVDHQNKAVGLTSEGKTLVEAIINTEIQ